MVDSKENNKSDLGVKRLNKQFTSVLFSFFPKCKNKFKELNAKHKALVKSVLSLVIQT